MNAQVSFNSCNFCVGLDVSVKLEALYSKSGTILNQLKIVICIWWDAFFSVKNGIVCFDAYVNEDKVR